MKEPFLQTNGSFSNKPLSSYVTTLLLIWNRRKHLNYGWHYTPVSEKFCKLQYGGTQSIAMMHTLFAKQ